MKMWKFFKKKADKEPKEKNPLLHTYMTSLLSLVLCVSMFFGTSYAWFTSEVENTGNEIYIGTLEAGLLIEKMDGTDVENLFDKSIRWEPGYTSLRTLTVKNTGDLAFKYELGITLSKAIDNDGSDITDAEAIKKITDQFTLYTYKGTYESAGKTFKDIEESTQWTKVGTLTDALKAPIYEGGVDKKDEGETYTIALHMNEAATSDLMGKKLSLSVKLTAYQKSAEKDDFGNDLYDNFSDYANIVEVTPENLGTTDFTADDTAYLFSGNFTGVDVLKIQSKDGMNQAFDGTKATNVGEVLVNANANILDGYAAIKDAEKAGNYVVQNFNAKQLSVFAYNTSVLIDSNTVEFIGAYGGNVALDITNNKIDANFTSHNMTNPGDNSSYLKQNSDYAVYLAICEYDLTFDGNTVTDAISHVVGINGNQMLGDTSINEFLNAGKDTNRISSFAGNTITVNATAKTDRAALKIWDDAVYGPTDSQETMTIEATALVERLLNSNNTFEIGTGHIYFQFYNVGYSPTTILE